MFSVLLTPFGLISIIVNPAGQTLTKLRLYVLLLNALLLSFFSLNAAMIHFIIQGHDLDLCVKAGLLAAQHSLQSHSAVPASITPASLSAEKVDEWARFTATHVGTIV